MPVQEWTEESERAAEPRRQEGRREEWAGTGYDSRSDDRSSQKAAEALGWFSVGLGMVELFFPRKLAKLIGARPRPIRTRLMGLREIGVGVGILTSARPGPWVKARVAGDAVDLKNLTSAFRERDTSRVRLTAATAAVVGVTAADLIVAKQLSGRGTATNRIVIEGSMGVNRSPDECYQFWLDFRNAPKFMKGLESVEGTGEGLSRWRMKPANLLTVSWESETKADPVNKAITWRSIRGDIEHLGSARFEKPLDGKGTLIRLTMEYAPPALGSASIAPLMRGLSEMRLKEDLRRFKSLIESGEVPTTDGQTSGRMEARR